MGRKRFALKENQIQEVDHKDVDVDLPSANSFLGSHGNLIPMPSAVQGPRVFYGSRFVNQALPIVNPEAPLVQNLIDGDQEGRSFDEFFGRHAGAVRSHEDGTVTDVSPDEINYKNSKGEKKVHHLHNAFPFNRKTQITQTSLVKPGDAIKAGQLVAHSNYTDKEGTLALGLNARVGLLPYKGHSMDDAIVISEPFAKRLTSDHSYTMGQDFDHETKGGLHHYVSLFPTTFTKTQIKTLDDNGVVKPGTKVMPGDPLILATRPKAISSSSSALSNLSKAMRNSRADITQTWDGEEPGEIKDVVHNGKSVKLVIQTQAATKKGDKIVFRSGQKGVVSLILPEAHMPRTADGSPLEVMANHLGIPSRVNDSLVYETLMGKIAKHQGKAIKLPGFTKPGEFWYDKVEKALSDAGLKKSEELFDPLSNRKLENPVTVGNAYLLKLHHTSVSKASSRGQGGYSADMQPIKGGGPAAQAKRLSGLEIHSMLSAGAYANLREGSTLRGQKNDEYWRAIRSGYKPRDPGEPFVYKKFHALLQGAGLHARDIGGGKLRLGPFTEKDFDAKKPITVKHGELVNLNTMEPVEGGLFDPGIVGNNSWGRIPLPFSVPNPSMEPAVRHLLGLTQHELREIMCGRMDLPEHLR